MSKGMKMIKFEGEIDYEVQRDCSSDCININLVDKGLRPSCFTRFEYEDIKELQPYFDKFKNIDIYNYNHREYRSFIFAVNRDLNPTIDPKIFESTIPDEKLGELLGYIYFKDYPKALTLDKYYCHEIYYDNIQVKAEISICEPDIEKIKTIVDSFNKCFETKKFYYVTRVINPKK